jgi:hypothetical protein
MQRRKFNGKILWWSLNLVEEDGDGQSTPKNRKILQKKLQLLKYLLPFMQFRGGAFVKISSRI